MPELLERVQAALASRYPIERKLGEGGAAVVFLAADLKHTRPVAVKVLRPEVAATLGTERFVREIGLAARLSHPHILTLIDSGEADGLLYYVMPYVESDSLRTRLRREPPLSVDEAAEIARSVAAALDHAHRHGIVHRDIKPENILLHDGLAVVTDFGIATALTAAGGERLTATGIAVGTPAYMSPEQFVGDRKIDGRSDLYSLGCVLYEMLVGQPPFAGVSTQAILAKRFTGPEPRVSAARSDIAPEVDDVVRRSMSVEAASRFSTGAELAQALTTATTRSRVRGVTAGDSRDEERAAGKSVVVLPFTNLSLDPDDAYFSDGLTEELTTDLSRVSTLRVISSASAFRYKGTEKGVRTIGHELAVGYVLSGTVRKSGRSVRITAQLIDVRDESSVWAAKHSAEVENVFDVQEQVSRAIAEALEIKLRPSAGAKNTAAAEAYLKGRHFLRQSTGQGLMNAVECFQHATEIDPGYAPAFSALAQTYVWLTAAWFALPARETMPKARAAALRAVELDPSLPEAHVALAVVATYYDWDLRKAELSFNEALRLNPNYVDAHKWYSMALIWLDVRFEEAFRHVRRAIDLDPVDAWLQVQYVFVYYFSRDFEGAIAQGRHAVALEPLYGYAHYALGTSLATAGKAAEAITSITHGIELDGRGVHYVSWLGCSHAIAGDRINAMECLAELEAQEKEGRSVWAWKLSIFSALGDTDAVMRCLDQAFEERSAALVFHLTHPLVDCVRDDPRFTNLLHRMNVAHLSAYRPKPRWLPAASRVVDR